MTTSQPDFDKMTFTDFFLIVFWLNLLIKFIKIFINLMQTKKYYLFLLKLNNSLYFKNFKKFYLLLSISIVSEDSAAR